MGNGYTRNDTGNNIADGNTANAADIDGEFDALEGAFDASTGHTHDGTSAEGAPITVVGPAQEYVADGSSFSPKTDATYTLGSASNAWNRIFAASLSKRSGGAGFFIDTGTDIIFSATAGTPGVLKSQFAMGLMADYQNSNGAGDSVIDFGVNGTYYMRLNNDGHLIIGSGQATGGSGVGRISFNGNNFIITPTDGAGAYQEDKQFYFDYSADIWKVEADFVIATKTPSSASDTGVTGTIAWDADYIYICTATNTWKRAAIATW